MLRFETLFNAHSFVENEIEPWLSLTFFNFFSLLGSYLIDNLAILLQLQTVFTRDCSLAELYFFTKRPTKGYLHPFMFQNSREVVK